MPFQESPAQRSAQAARDAFFGAQPLNGPSLPQQSGIRESPSQVARRQARESFFAGKSLRPSSVRQVSDSAQSQASPPMKIMPVTGGKTQNEARNAGTGTLILQDCDGAEIIEITDLSGFDGEKTVKVGCEGSSSYPV